MGEECIPGGLELPEGMRSQKIEKCHRIREEEDIFSQKIRKSHEYDGKRKQMFTEDRKMLTNGRKRKTDFHRR